MKKRVRITATLMLLVIGFLFIKNLWLRDDDQGVENCGEIAHIHFFHLQVDQRVFDEECHGEKSLFAFSFCVCEIHAILTPSPRIGFHLVFEVENGFKSPDLEPRRKPPKGLACSRV